MSFLPRSLRALAFAWFALIGLNRVAAVEAPVRIMPLGDSITYGQAEEPSSQNPADWPQGGYRDRLYALLTQQGFNVDFVGTLTDANNPELPDKNHQGMRGYRVDEINASIGGWLNEVADPDVILIQIGTNDFLQVSRNETPSGVLAKLDALITNLATRRPFAKIIVSTLVLSTYSASVESKQVTFNQGIPALVAQHAAKGRQVSMVDLHPVLNASDLYDTVHPTTAGYEKMANAWLPAVTSVIAPKGTSNPPLIAKAETTNDLTKVFVTFSKPVADSATALSNFSISGGITVSGAVLDSTTKRTVTLTTTSQTKGQTYTLTVNGIQDRTAQLALIAPQSKAMFTSPLLTNGGFEDSYTGWPTHTGNLEIEDKRFDSPYSTSEGNKLVAFNTGDQTPNGVLTQSFPTTAGQSYLITYDLGIASWQYNWTQKLGVKALGSNTLLNTTSIITGVGGAGSSPAVFWFPWSHEFTANTATTTLTFTDVSDTNQSWGKDMLLDNIRIVRADSGPYLAVTSTLYPGASLTINPNDLEGNGNGTSGLIRSYDTGTAVTLTAPATTAGKSFQKWQLNGADIAGTNRTVTVTLNNNTTLNAFYDPTVTPPLSVADSCTTLEDTPLAVAAPGVLGNDSDGLPLTAVLSAGPTKGILTLNSDGSFSYTPNLNANGADSFTYRAYNGVLYSSVTTVSLTVTPVNDPPVAVNDGSPVSPFLTVNESSGISTTMQVLLNDSDPENNTITISAVSSPNGTAVTANTNTRLRFTPTTNFSGLATISYTISDGNGATATATVYVFVNNLDNDPPAAVAQSVSVDEDTPTAITLVGTDVDSPNLTFTKGNPSHGTLTGTAPNLTYTPTANYSGPDSFTFTVRDGSITSSPATVSITVNPVNDTPVAAPKSVAVNEDGSIAITLAGTDADGQALTFIQGSPSNGILTGTAPNLTYTPAANYSGQDSFTFTVSDGILTSAPAAVSITVTPVNDAPLATVQSASGDEDTAVPIILTGSDLEGQVLTFTAGSPGHGLLTGTAPNLTYTPAANYSGQDSFTFTVSDGILTSTPATVSITVTPVNDAPVAAAQSVITEEDTAVPIILTGNDLEDQELTFTAGTPGHGSLSGTATNLTYTPAGNYSGQDSFTFTVSDGILTSEPATVSITVTPVNDAPVATAQSATADEDTAVPIILTGSDLEGQGLTFTAGSPGHGSLSGTAPNLTYTPASNYSGPDSFTFTVSDGILTSAPTAVSITVNPINDAPLAMDEGYSTAEDAVLTTAIPGVLANDSDVEETALTAVLLADVTHGTLSLTPDGSFEYTPDADFHGEDSFTYKASDATLESNIATVTITITPVNDAPVAAAKSVTAEEDTAVPIILTGSDLEGQGLTFTAGSPGHGSLSGTAPNLTYTPAGNYSGQDSFTFTVSDGILTSEPATISITVNPINDAPLAMDEGYSTAEDAVLTTAIPGVLANDSDVEETALTAVLLADVTHGTLSLTPDGSFEYTPDADFHGEDSFTYKASDATLESNIGTVTITVTPVNDAPVAAAQSVTTDEDTALPITLAGADVDGEEPTFTVGSPVHGTLSGTPPNLTYTPATNYHGEDSFIFTVSDGILTSEPAIVTITVTPVNDAPLATVQSASGDEDTAVPITLTGSDLEGQGLTFTTGTPGHGSLNGTAPNLTYTPASNYSGPDSFTFTVSDGILTSEPATVSITVNPINDAPLAMDEGYSTAEDAVLTTAIPGVLANDSDVEETALTAVLLADVTHGTLSLTPDGSFEYTPDADFHGEDSFTYKASDATLESNIATVTITITPVNDAPVAAAQSVTTDEDTALPITLTGADVDGEEPTFTVGSPAHGTLSGTAPNLTYTPATNYHGEDSFTFTVSDGILTSEPAVVTITVTPVNDAPVAMDESFSTGEDTVLTGTPSGVLAHAWDAEETALTAVLVDDVTHGTLSLAPDGSFEYTPDADFHGEDSFTYKASDTFLESSTATVTITVVSVNDAPVAIAQSRSVDEDLVLTTTLAGTDLEGAALTFTVAAQPTSGTVTLNGAIAVYTPTADYHGPDSFSFTVSDGTLTSAPAVVAIVVNPLEEFTQWIGPSNQPPAPGDDSDGDSVSNMIEYVIGGDPTGASDAGLMPTVALGSSVPGQMDCLVFTYRRATRARDDPSTNIKVEWATALTGPWFEADGTHGEIIDVEVNAAGPGIDLVHVTVPCPPGSDGHLFSRLGVSINLPPAIDE